MPTTPDSDKAAPATPLDDEAAQLAAAQAELPASPDLDDLDDLDDLGASKHLTSRLHDMPRSQARHASTKSFRDRMANASPARRRLAVCRSSLNF